MQTVVCSCSGTQVTYLEYMLIALYAYSKLFRIAWRLGVVCLETSCGDHNESSWLLCLCMSCGPNDEIHVLCGSNKEFIR